MKPELTQERLKELLHYDPETGHFTWRVSRSWAAVLGSRAGSNNSRGYASIGIDGRDHLAHRLAFLYMTGGWPPVAVDHISRDKSDNRWANLRPATKRENACNVGLQRNNTSGYRGVVWDRRAGKWRARGTRYGRDIYLGYFDRLEEAAIVARKWREEDFGEFDAGA